MAEVLLFHHAQGLTPGVVAFADELRAAGHTVHTPDLFDGRTFDSIDEGMAFINDAGFDDVARARRPHGRRPARRARVRRLLVRRDGRAEARPDAARRARAPCSSTRASRSAASGRSDRGRTACRSRSTAWTPTRYFVGEGDIDAAREIVAQVEDAELFLYPGDQHYFADSSLPSYDAEATALLTRRVLEFLDRV